MDRKRAFFAWAVTALAFWKLSLHVYGVSFSCLTFVLPLIGALLSRRSASACSMSAWGLAHLTHLPITLGIPTLCATLSWGAQDRKSQLALHVFLPLSCMALFACAADAGSWPYALYWLIPPVLHFFPFGILSRSLQSTFVAHAVGSVIWALCIPMSAAHWLSLIPVVAVERLSMAAAGVALLWIMQKASQADPHLLKNS